MKRMNNNNNLIKGIYSKLVMSRLSFHELLIDWFRSAVGRGTILGGILSSLDLHTIISRSLTHTVISVGFYSNEKWRGEKRATLQIV